MSRIHMLLCAAALAFCAHAKGPATVKLDCLSLRFQKASGGPGEVATLELTSDPDLNERNGELAPLFNPNAPSHGSFFILEDPTLIDSIAGQIAFDTPAPTDANGDGFDDFFQLDESVPASTAQGFFRTPVDEGTVTATWSRAAGTSVGSCRLRLIGETFGELPQFSLTFELLEYEGTLVYTTDTNKINGQLQLKQRETPASTLTGALVFNRNSTNRFDQLLLLPGALTNASSQPMPFLAEIISRDTTTLTNYSGYFDFDDGEPATGLADYLTWVLSIDDPNDSDADDIPDFSDDPVTSGGQRPTLGLTRNGEQLLLSLTGTPSLTYEIQELPVLGGTNWQKVTTLTLTNESATLPLTISGTSQFWRAVVP